VVRRGLSQAALEHVRQELAPGGRVVRVRPMQGGISSSVHLVHLQARDGKRQAVVVRRYGTYLHRVDPSACEREFRVLQVLARSGFPVPSPLLLDADGEVYGARTLVMERVVGRPLLAPDDLGDYLDQTARTLARLHALPIADVAFLPELRVDIERALSEYRGRQADDLQAAIYAAACREWASIAAKTFPMALVHGDYWPGNILWRRNRLIGVIDWEQPRIGDPVKDVATCRGDISILFGMAAADEFLRRYIAAGGASVETLPFYELLISTWAVREIEQWAVVYPLLGRPDLTPAAARERIRTFAQAALHNVARDP